MEKQAWHAANLRRVNDTLNEIDAHELCSVKGPGKKGCLTFWGLQGAVMIVQEYSDESGLEVFRLFVPSSKSMSMDDLVASIKDYHVRLLSGSSVWRRKSADGRLRSPGQISPSTLSASRIE